MPPNKTQCKWYDRLIMESFHKLISSLRTAIIIVFFSLVPFIFVPLTQDPYDFPKWMFVLGAVLSLILLWSIEVLVTHRLELHGSPGFYSFTALAVAGGISLLVSSPNKIEGALALYGPVTFGSLALLFLLTEPLSAKAQQLFRWIFIGCAIVLSLIAIYQYLEIGKLILPQLMFLKDSAWTPVGSGIGLVSILLVLSPFLMAEFVHAVKHRQELSLAVTAAGTVIVICAWVLTLIKFVPTISRTVLPYQSGWAIILETFKEPRSAIFGVGAENFFAAFTKGRPISLNTTQLWNVRFDLNSTLFMHLTATFGLLGILALLILVRYVLPKQDSPALKACRILAIAVLLLTPPNFTVLVLIAGLLFLSRSGECERTMTIHVNQPRRLPATCGAIVLFALVGLSVYVLGRAYAAELYYQQALQAISKNDGTNSYNLLVRTLTLNPYITRYRMSYAQVNLGLANGLAANLRRESDGSGTQVSISDKDRTLLSSLMSQAVREAKLTTNLAPENALAWENLAKIYEALIGAVGGSDQWAIASYSRAIQLDPTDPLLRFELGSLYTQMKSYDEAQAQFQAAAGLKPDYPNAIYNLAFIYREQKQWLRAAAALRKVLEILPASEPSSRQRATSEYEDALSHLTKEEKQMLLGTSAGVSPNEETQLTIPPTPIPTLNPLLELSTDAAAAGEPQE